MTKHRPNQPCTFDRCGGTYFYDWGNKWECSNCCREYPKKQVYRRTNKLIAIDIWKKLRDEWEPITSQLEDLIRNNRAMSGCLLVHTSTFNYHMNQLMSDKKLSNFDLHYHTKQAKLDLEKAKLFVREKSNG